MAAHRGHRACPRGGGGPQPAGLGLAGARREDRHRGIVDVQVVAGENVAGEGVDQRLQRRCYGSDPTTGSRSPGSPGPQSVHGSRWDLGYEGTTRRRPRTLHIGRPSTDVRLEAKLSDAMTKARAMQRGGVAPMARTPARKAGVLDRDVLLPVRDGLPAGVKEITRSKSRRAMRRDAAYYA